MRIRFIQNFFDIIKNKLNNKGPWSVPYTKPNNTYEKIVCPLGFGHSGSGALLDILSEFSNVTTLGSHDTNGSQYNKASYGEIDFVRRFGGLFDLETAFTIKNHNIRDYKLKCFITLMEYFYSLGGIYTDKFYELTNNFIDEITDFKIQTDNGCEANMAFSFPKSRISKFSNLKQPFVKNKFKEKYIYFLKDLSVEEYTQKASKLIKDFLNTIESKEYLVLDQFLSDNEANFDKMIEYLGSNSRCIAVYRDPRDVYATGISMNISWISNDPKIFTRWYKCSVEKYIQTTHDSFLLLRFEDLIYNYEDSVMKICDFLSLNPKDHINKKKYFVPEISQKNVGLYKKYCSKEILEYIERELSEFCYKGE